MTKEQSMLLGSLEACRQRIENAALLGGFKFWLGQAVGQKGVNQLLFGAERPGR